MVQPRKTKQNKSYNFVLSWSVQALTMEHAFRVGLGQHVSVNDRKWISPPPHPQGGSVFLPSWPAARGEGCEGRWWNEGLAVASSGNPGNARPVRALSHFLRRDCPLHSLPSTGQLLQLSEGSADSSCGFSPLSQRSFLRYHMLGD